MRPISTSTTSVRPVIPVSTSTSSVRPVIPVSTSTSSVRSVIPVSTSVRPISTSTTSVRPVIPVSTSTSSVRPVIPVSTSTSSVRSVIPVSTSVRPISTSTTASVNVRPISKPTTPASVNVRPVSSTITASVRPVPRPKTPVGVPPVSSTATASVRPVPRPKTPAGVPPVSSTTTASVRPVFRPKTPVSVPPVSSTATASVRPVPRPKTPVSVPPVATTTTTSVRPVPISKPIIPVPKTSVTSKPIIPVATVRTQVDIKPGKKGVKPLILKDRQKTWAAKADHLLRTTNGYFDTSDMGAGKMIIAIYLALVFDFSLLVIGPKTIIQSWRNHAAEYGVDVIDVLSYGAVRGKVGYQPTSGLLNRSDIVTDTGRRKVLFEPSEYYLQLLNSGILLIIDEIQNVIQKSAIHKACNVLLRTMIETGGQSRFGLLSGTPYCKEENVINLLRLAGYIKSSRMCRTDPVSKDIIPEVLQELIDVCYTLDPDTTSGITAEGFRKDTVANICHRLYSDVLREHMVGAMTAPQPEGVIYDIKNGFYNIDPDHLKLLQKAVYKLSETVNTDEDGKEVIDMIGRGKMVKALVAVEQAKLYDMARIARETLETVPNSKVIILLNYSKINIPIIVDMLADYQPELLTGSSSVPERQRVLDRFNDDPSCRLLIGNIKVAGVGNNMHDVRGDSPRYMYISPTFDLLAMAQAAKRVWREGVMSDATVRTFYAKETGKTEIKILTALAKKSGILKETVSSITAKDMILPSDYESYYEPDVTN